MDNIFEYRDWLDNHDKEDGSYRYYEQKYNARKDLLNLFGTPFFEEIKRNTEGIQKVLKESGYENIDGLLKALIIDGIKFFLHLDYQIRIDDDIHYDDYFLGLFDSLKINTNNKKLLNDILSELESGGEELPKSPLNILVNYGYKKPDDTENGQQKAQELEKAKPIKLDNLQRIIDDFWKKDYGFIKDLRTVGVEENRLEYIFLTGLYGDISDLLNGKHIDSRKIDKIYDYYNINIKNKEFLLKLKKELESRLSLNTTKADDSHNRLQKIKKKENEFRNAHNRLSGKEFLHGHRAFDDSPKSIELHGENVVIYKVGDEYIPCDNTCANRVEFIKKLYSCSLSELKIMYITKFHNPFIYTIKDDQRCKMFIQQTLTDTENIDLLQKYKNGERFEVIKGTYNDKTPHDSKYLSCRFVNIRSIQTGEEYTALSK